MTPKSKTIAAWLGVRGPGRMPDLGAREMQVLECLWAYSKAPAQRVHAQLAGRRITLTTVQSTLERLHRKGLVHREKQGRAYWYAPTHSRSQFIGRLLRDIADDVAGGELAAMISGFAEYAASENAELDLELSRWLQRQDGEHD